MWNITKHWFWYDWMCFFVRLVSLLSISIGTIVNQVPLSVPSWVIILTAILTISIPFLIQQFSKKWYLLSEIVLTGSFCMYLTSQEPQLVWQFVIFAFVIGFYSDRSNYMWTALPTIFIIPGFNAWQVNEPIDIIILNFMVNHGAVFALGYAFQILALNHKQSKIIRDQKQVLEQHINQIEELTLKEERNRLSHELHDTIGHTLTSLIVGMESLKTSFPSNQSERIDTLVELARNGLDDIRQHLHHLAATPTNQSFTDSLQQLIEEFTKATGITVNFRTFGNEVSITKQISFCLYRCLQESLTNAVRHGQANTIQVQLLYDNQQLRLQIEDNGIGMEQVRYGFGLSGMKERLDECTGSLTVHSRSNEGTVIICTLPLKVEAVQSGIRLLLVDDQSIITESLQRILEQQPDLKVIGTADNGQQALERCAIDQPDLVLMDVRMPEMDGIEALREMKQRWPQMKVALLTTFEDVSQAVKSIELGAEGYMLKSIHPRDLIEAIKLIHNGGTWIDQNITVQVFEQMKHQRGQLGNQNYSPENNPYGITKRELEILQHLSNGLRYKSIAAKLFLSEGTIRNYCSTLYSKLGVSNREDAIEKARTEGLGLQ
ncbi:hybrid sensor histidine kinase/response regulator transcription factor [Paenibacillus arenosi]|uniref:Response regulator n=1 Tax=Paenibacillus arenosi TaxID=2774142 RepID=A0ABR9AZY1_9BACL|nr:hybrid sensor histidine kinase/response regulator transcription factor [Paenibacillus arenosi]MBD8499436.1 response regulator [Paenibacillus arenosi]